MTVALDKIVQVHGLCFASITDHAIMKSDQFGVFFFQCAKRPMAVLMCKEGQIKAFRPDGSNMRLDRIENCYPGVLEEFAGRCSSHDPY